MVAFVVGSAVGASVADVVPIDTAVEEGVSGFEVASGTCASTMEVTTSSGACTVLLSMVCLFLEIIMYRQKIYIK